MQSKPNIHSHTRIKETNQGRDTFTRRVVHIRPKPIQTTIKDRVKVPATHDIQDMGLVPRQVPVGGIETRDIKGHISKRERTVQEAATSVTKKEATEVSLDL